MRSLLAITFALIQVFGCYGAVNPRLSFFDIDLLQSTAEYKSGNVVISPASVKSTLSMLLEGAVGDTAAEIKTALRLSPLRDDFRKELILFVKALEVNTTNVILRSANALFLSKKLKLKRDYEKIIHGLYSADVTQLDFTNPRTSVETINQWVNKKTEGLIPSIVNEGLIFPNTEMILANTLYYKANWKYSFDIKSTRKDCFLRNGVCRNVAMMELQAELKYAFVDNLKAHALELPYQGDRYSMLLLVPQYHDGAEALIRDLPYIGVPQISDMMDINDVLLAMPKFTIDYSVNLMDALKKLRINSLFSSSANLSGIFESAEASYANSIYQSVHMKVDEVGTEAAAATIGVVVPLINNRVILKVDKPFLFFIRDKELDINLFEGKIEEPTEFIEAVTKKAVPLMTQTVPLATVASQTNPLLFTSRHSTADLAGSSYTSNQGSFNQPIVQTNQGPYQLKQTSTNKPQTDPSIGKSKDTQNEKNNGGVVGWFKRTFLGGDR